MPYVLCHYGHGVGLGQSHTMLNGIPKLGFSAPFRFLLAQEKQKWLNISIIHVISVSFCYADQKHVTEYEYYGDLNMTP